MADNVVVSTPAPITVQVQTTASSVVVTQASGPSVAVVENGATPQNVFVQNDEPQMATAGMWIQTFDNGDWTLWIEDGK